MQLPTSASRLVDFFRFYARDFQYNTGVASIRAGLLKKDSKGWASEVRCSIFIAYDTIKLRFNVNSPTGELQGNGIDYALR